MLPSLIFHTDQAGLDSYNDRSASIKNFKLYYNLPLVTFPILNHVSKTHQIC